MKCHPDMAGCGIEYSWGKLKIDFRRLNRCNGKEKGNQAQLMEGKIESLLDTGTLKIERVWKFDRKARMYRRQLAEDIENGIENENCITDSALEHMAKKEATNRNILEIGRDWIHNACAEN